MLVINNRRREVVEAVADALLGRDEWEPCVACDRPVDPKDEILRGSTLWCPHCYTLQISRLAARTARVRSGNAQK